MRAAVAEKVTGANLFMQVAQDINVGVRLSRGGFEYTLQSVDVAELIEWSQKLLDKLQTLPQLTNVSSDLLAKAPQLNVKINRDHASRFGISAQMIDDTLYDAYGQRQVTQYYTQLNTSPLILEITPELQSDLSSLDRLYIKSPVTGGAVPLSALVDVDSNKTGPLTVNHQGQFPAVTLAFNLKPGVALGQAVDAITAAARDIGMPGSIIGTFQGNAQAFQNSLSTTPVLICAALIVVYIILGILYESFIHPLTILSTLPSAGVGALLASGRRRHGLVGHRDHRNHPADRHRQEERHHACRLCDHCGTRRHDASRSDSHGMPAAIPTDPHDHGCRHARRRPAGARHRSGFGATSAAGVRHGWRACSEPVVDALHDAGGLFVPRPAADADARRSAKEPAGVWRREGVAAE